MAERGPYLDTALLVRLHVGEPGAVAVRNLVARHSRVSCSVHGRVELAWALHRHLREGRISHADLVVLLDRFDEDGAKGRIVWLDLSEEVLAAARTAVRSLPSTVPLRSADALHLASARLAGFDSIHSNDRHLLGAAGHFGLRGIDPLSGA